jgi:methyl-accepting chemotaxis protein
MSEYESLVEVTVENEGIQTQAREEMDKSAADFLENCSNYLASQRTQVNAELAGGGTNNERIEKIYLINDIIDYGNTIRVMNFKAQATRDIETLREALGFVDKIKEKEEEIRQYTRLEADLEALDNILSSLEAYKNAINNYLDAWQKLNEAGQARDENAKQVLDGAETIAEAGVGATQEIADEATKSLENSSYIMIIGLSIALILGILLAIIITRAITRPIVLGVEFAKKMADGDLTATINVDQTDEIGDLAKALQDMSKRLRDIVTDVVSGAENIASASQQMSSNSQQVSQGATEQAASAEEVSSSMEEMSANIQQNTDNAQQTEKIAEQAAGDIQEGNKSVGQTVESMKTIAEKISIISEIAFQTNILALNAAVEAARAGEHGKGFAVVAAEVRKLAERSQVAANEIDEVSASSVDIAEQSGKLLEEIVPNIQKTAKLVQEISAASMEQSSGADQVNNAIQQLNQVTQQNAAAAEEMATASEELSSQADQLNELVGFFNIGDSHRKKVAKKVEHSNKKMDELKKQQQAETSGNGQQKTANKKDDGKGIDLKMDDEKDSEYEKF